VSDPSLQANRVETLALTAIFAGVATLLLLLLPVQTRSGPASSGWWTQPWLMPGIALSALFVANMVSLISDIVRLRRDPPGEQEKAEAWSEVLGWFRPLEFFAYFLGYLASLAYLGYFLSTALFIQFILYRVKLRTARWRLLGLLAALALTMIFRWGLGIWVPNAELYDLFPDAVRKFLTRWF
jgi:hypothetical protein